jgi:hypothetical protein
MLSRRHALVIGSQCDALPPLDFVTDRVDRLIRLLTDPERGGCEPEGSGSARLLDPSISELKAAVRQAVLSAASVHASLLVVFIGHGVTRQKPDGGTAFFLMPADGDPEEPDSDTAYEAGHVLKTLLSGSAAKDLDGMFLILDACHAGTGALEVMTEAATITGKKRLQILGSTFDEVSYEGCFSRSLIELMQHGDPYLSTDFLGGQEAANAGFEACGDTQQEPYFSMATTGRSHGDQGLFLTRNVASPTRWALSGTKEGEQAVSLTRGYQATEDLERVMGTLIGAHMVVIVAGPGSGKSSLVSALARPELLPDRPARYLAAVAFTNLTRTVPDIAASLATQLCNTPGFEGAETAYRQGLNEQEYENQPALERRVFGPLKRMRIPPGSQTIRLAIDGLDQLEAAAQHELLEATASACADPLLRKVRVLLTTRPSGHAALNTPHEAVRLELAAPQHDEIMEYLSHGVEPEIRHSLISQGRTWLELSLLADTETISPGDAVREKTGSLDSLYDRWISATVPASDQDARAVLATLGAAGSGPNLPVSIAVAAASRLGGPGDVPRLRDTMLGVGSMIARANPGAETETLGLFHETLVQYLRYREDWKGLVTEAHTAILDELNTSTDPAAQAYRRSRAPEHLWALKRYREALNSVIDGLGLRAGDNRDLLLAWSERAEGALPADDRAWLRFNYQLGNWIGEAGDPAGARARLRHVLEAQVTALGPEHTDTLETRQNIARWTGETGDAAGALKDLRALLEDRIRIQGPDHPDSFRTRGNVAYWTGETGDAAAALKDFRALLEDLIRIQGPDHPDTLKTRGNVAYLTGETGDAAAALNESRALLEDLIRIQGPDHPDTLKIHSYIAYWTGETGDAAAALKHSRALLKDRIRMQGPDHPDVLTTRDHIALLTGETGDAAGALEDFRALLEDRIRFQGPDHPDVLSTRHCIAYWTGKTGDTAAALDDFRALLGDRIRIQGPDHPDTLNTRDHTAYLAGKFGDTAAALKDFRALLEDRIRIQGPDHPDTLNTRGTIAYLAGKSGDATAALKDFRALLEDRIRIQGPDHPDTLKIRSHIAYWKQQNGGAPPRGWRWRKRRGD